MTVQKQLPLRPEEIRLTPVRQEGDPEPDAAAFMLTLRPGAMPPGLFVYLSEPAARRVLQLLQEQFPTARAKKRRPRPAARKHYAGAASTRASCGLRMKEDTPRVSTEDEFWEAYNNDTLCRSCYRAATNEASPY